jgi:N-acetylmuramoyl-L-alanine amidase
VQDGDLIDVVKASNNFKADYFVSIHCNSSADKTSHGVETYCFLLGGRGEKLADNIQTSLVSQTGLTNRGVKTANFYVLKYTNMTAVLIEAGFMDVMKEASLMLNVDFQKEVARETAIAVCKYLGVTYVPYVEPKPIVKAAPGKYFRVQVGAFTLRTGAEKLQAELKAKGFSAIIKEE